VPKDTAQAVSWLRKTAERGDVNAQHNLGLLYDKGEGVPRDVVQAMVWWRKAAEQGNASAQVSWGVMYASGDVVLKDSVAAYMWWNLATAQGDKAAKNDRDIVEKTMTSAQIAEAKKMSREWRAGTFSH